MEKVDLSQKDSLLLSPEEYLSVIRDNTDADGFVFLPDFDDLDEGNDPGMDMDRFRVDWSTVTEDAIRDEFRETVAGLRFFAKEPENVMRTAPSPAWSASVWNIWFRYFRRLDSIRHVDPEEYAAVYDRVGTDEERPEDRDFLDEVENARIRAAHTRLGESFAAPALSNYVRRVFRLFQLNAPEPIVRHESNKMLAWLTLYRIGEDPTSENRDRWNRDSFLRFARSVYGEHIPEEEFYLDGTEMDALNRMLDELKPEERKVVTMTVRDGKSRRLVALLMFCPLDQVIAWEARAYRKLRHPKRIRHIKPYLMPAEQKKETL